MIYFPAGADFVWQTQAVVQTYAKAALLTAHSFVVGQKPVSSLAYILSVLKDRPTLVDSGMFTLQGQVWTTDGTPYHYKSSDWMRRYVDRYAYMLSRMNYRGFVVECDCHSLTEKWEADLEYARNVLKSAFGDRLIYVWHIPEGFDALARAAKTRKRLAVSDPAIRRAFSSFKDPVRTLIGKLRLPASNHFHVLGTGNFRLTHLPDNYSIDSSTWSMIVRYGRAIPNSPFAVYWWRRKVLKTLPVVLESVDEKFDQCRRAGAMSPLNKTKRTDDAYLRALAAALVASQMHCESEAKHYHHKKSESITGPWKE